MGRILNLQSELGLNDFRFCMTDEHMIGTIKYFVTALFKNNDDNNWQGLDISSERSHMLTCSLAHGI